MNNSQIFEATISIKETKKDKYKRNYLLLELENHEKLFVFASKVKSVRWPELEEGKQYEFTCEETDKGTKILLDFVETGSDFFI